MMTVENMKPIHERHTYINAGPKDKGPNDGCPPSKEDDLFRMTAFPDAHRKSRTSRHSPSRTTRPEEAGRRRRCDERREKR